MKLEIESVLQPQRPELLLAQIAAKPPCDLITELCGAGSDELMVKGVIAIHRRGDSRRRGGRGIALASQMVGRRQDAGAAAGADILARRGAPHPVLRRHLIGSDDGVGALGTVDSLTGPLRQPAGKAMRLAGILGPAVPHRCPGR